MLKLLSVLLISELALALAAARDSDTYLTTYASLLGPDHLLLPLHETPFNFLRVNAEQTPSS